MKWRVAGAAVLLGLVGAACSSSTNDAASTSSSSIVVSEPSVTLAGELPAKESVQALRELFLAAVIDPDKPQEVRTVLRTSTCPLGDASQLMAVAAATVAGLDASTTFTLEMSRDPIPAVRCTFSNNLPADLENSIPANLTSSFLDYQVTYVPGAGLRRYLTLLDSEGYEKAVDPVVGGVVYTHCVEPDPAVNEGEGFQDCAAIWLNGVVVVALRFSGPDGRSVDVPGSLARMIEPILNSLADADATTVGVPTPGSGTTP
ncbi:MAG: hypothetical protein ABI862_02720 [Ilumatobacteraceae bacterium]